MIGKRQDIYLSNVVEWISKQILSFLPMVYLPRSRAISLCAEMELELWANCSKKGKKVGNLYFTSMQKIIYNHDSLCYLIIKTGSIIPVKIVVLKKPTDFHLFVPIGLPELLFSLRTGKI